MEEIIQWPLVLFSLLAGAGGCAFAFAGASEFVGGTKRARFAVGVVSLVLVVVGGLFSVLHLASPQHVMAAVRHVFSFSGVSVEHMVLGLLVVVGVVYLRFVGKGPAFGWGSLMSALLVFSGAQLVMLGVIGEYLGRAYLTANRRPQSVVREVLRGGKV